jgi:hypothetical protein
MAKRRKSIRLFDHERDLLVKKYVERKIPLEQYESREGELENLCAEWRGLTNCTYSNGDIFHYMRNERKCGRWVRFDGEHLRTPPKPHFSAEESEILVSVYSDYLVAFGIGQENIAYDDGLKAFIAKEFAVRAGKVVPIESLLTKLTAIRKRGKLTRVAEVSKPVEKDADTGFDDIEAVG